ncbi:MAG: DUF1294 domain-containing protein [Candidatus Falkowbacteria bacterium]
MSIDFNVFNITILVLIIINLISLLVMFWDKKKAEGGERRISEKALFLWVLFFGGIGIYLGMFWFRHKTRKWYFLIGVPLLIATNVYLLIKLFNITNLPFNF